MINYTCTSTVRCSGAAKGKGRSKDPGAETMDQMPPYHPKYDKV